MNTSYSERITILRFPLIIAVVFIHAYGFNVSMGGLSSGPVPAEVPGVAIYVQEFISHGLATVAVPLFYLISGYLFFSGDKFDRGTYVYKIKTRMVSLLVPYLFWNGLMVASYYVIQSLPLTRNLLSGNNKPVSCYEVFDYVNAMLGLGGSPIAYQFWFIRDLMLIVVVSPIVYCIIKTTSLLLPGLLMVFWMFDLWLPHAPGVGPVLFFSIGAYLKITKTDLFFCDSRFRILAVSFILLILISLVGEDIPLKIYSRKIAILVGLAAALAASKLLHSTETARDVLLKLSTYSFFVFAFHEPLLTAFKKVMFRLIAPSGSIGITFIYLFAPIVTIVLSIAVFHQLKNLFPRVASTITGGR